LALAESARGLTSDVEVVVGGDQLELLEGLVSKCETVGLALWLAGLKVESGEQVGLGACLSANVAPGIPEYRIRVVPQSGSAPRNWKIDVYVEEI
jgi:hypothetical protein